MTHSRRLRRKHSLGRSAQAGAIPGTVSADPTAPQPVITVLAYSPQQVQEQKLANLNELPGLLGTFPVTWINVDGLGNSDVIQQLGRQFSLHPLALEDTVNTHQRAKADDFGDILFVVLRMVQGPPLTTEQISFFIGRDFLITFQEELEGDSLNSVRDRIRHKRGRIRDVGTDYLMYELLDAIVDGYFPVLERYGEWLDDLDAAAETASIGQTLADLHAVRRDLLYLRRIVWPLRDVMLSLMRGGHVQISADTQVYLRDCYDHATQLIDILEIYRETCSDLRDFYYSKLSNRTNEIMRTLTVIATVFMPLSFIVGLYGMNFDHMPELHWAWGYPFCLGFMACIACTFLYFFWRKGWLKSAEQATPTMDASPKGANG